MKSKDKRGLHSKTIDELKQMLKDAKKDFFDFNLDKNQNKLKNTSSLALKKKEIAQILTVIHELEVKHE